MIDQIETINYLRAALKEIAKGEGPYSRDPLEHCGNTIDAIVAIAESALAGEWIKPEAE